MNDKIEKDVYKVQPLKKICMTIGELPTSYLETMTYYEMLVWFTNFLRDNIIPTVNNNAEAVKELQNLFTELQNYVNNYFDNLDVQEEINNKLDQMLKDGVLEQIIEQFIQSTALWCFDTVADMKQATNLINGSFVKTLGYREKNDGGKALYKIRTKTNEDIIDEGLIISLYDNTLVGELIELNKVTVEMFGAYGDGTHDDYQSIYNAITKCNNVYFNNKIYYVSQNFSFSNLSNKYINGNNATIKFFGYSDSSIGNIGLFNFNNCSNIIIESLNIDGDIEWIKRPYSWEDGYSNYTTLRGKTYDGYCFDDCSYINIDKCKATKVKVGFHFLETKNSYLNNSISEYTMADGVLIHEGSEDVHVENHYVYASNDDQFSMVHETSNTKYVKRCSFNNCSAYDSFGACAVMQECVDCNIENCTSIDNRTTPIKFGTSLGSVGCTNCYMNNINVTSKEILQGTNTTLSAAESNGVIVFGATSGSSPMINCLVSNSNFKETSGNNTNIYNPNISGLKFYNTVFDGINLIFTNIKSFIFENCIIKSKDCNVFTSSSFTMINTSVTNDLTYNKRGTNTIQCNGCSNVVLDNVTVSGTSTEYGNCIEFYAASSATGNVYLNTNDKKTRLVNESDVHNNGIIVLTDIDRYAYSRFREGQLLYFLSNHKLYVVGTSDWKALN